MTVFAPHHDWGFLQKRHYLSWQKKYLLSVSCWGLLSSAYDCHGQFWSCLSDTLMQISLLDSFTWLIGVMQFIKLPCHIIWSKVWDIYTWSGVNPFIVAVLGRLSLPQILAIFYEFPSWVIWWFLWSLKQSHDLLLDLTSTESFNIHQSW